MSKSQNHLFGLPGADLDHIVRLAAADLQQLRGKKLFLTGGTGFFGKWLLAALTHANAMLDLGVDVLVLSRNPDAFAAKHPEVDRPSNLAFLRGNVLDFTANELECHYIIHAATETTAFTTDAEEHERARVIVQGTQNLIELAKSSGARLLNISSGAVYGTAAARLTGVKEDEFVTSTAVTPYGEAKRAAESLCQESNINYVTARAFAFLGPYLPLDAHFAAGNFLRDALRGGPIIVRGDGTALRSYLHPADLVVWLLRILIQGKTRTAYNVGSDEAVTTAQLAHKIASAVRLVPEVVIQSSQPQGPQNIYLPNIDRARTELNLDVAIPLQNAITRTLAYLQTSGS